MKAYFGILLLAGVYRSHGEALENLWNDRNGRPIFKATMPLYRFQNITRVIRFDEKTDRIERRARDKLAPIRNLWDRWEYNLRKLYNPGPCVTIDEQLVTFRGRCPFKQFIPSKPGKYGLKIWALCDSDTNYAWSMQVYTGKDRNCQPEKNQGRRVVLDLVKDLKGRNVTCDNFFTSHELGIELLQKKLTVVGTVRKNKTFLPPKFTDLKGKPQHYSQFLFDVTNKTTIVSYVPKKNRSVILLSTLHHSAEIVSDTKKPEIIHFYNRTKSGVDTLDQLVRNYTCKRRSNRWPQSLFYNMLDICAYNAFVIYTAIDAEWNKQKRFRRRLFLEELGNALVHDEISRRSIMPRSSFAKSTVRSLQKKDKVVEKSALKRGRCYICPQRSSSTKYSNKCTNCNNFICKSHSNVIFSCENCKNDT